MIRNIYSRGGGRWCTSTTVNNMNPQDQHALYHYSRLKKLTGKYRDLERKYTLLKTIYIRIKKKEMGKIKY